MDRIIGATMIESEKNNWSVTVQIGRKQDIYQYHLFCFIDIWLKRFAYTLYVGSSTKYMSDLQRLMDIVTFIGNNSIKFFGMRENT